MSQMDNPFDTGYLTEHELASAGFRSLGVDVQIAKNCTLLGLQNMDIGSHVRIDAYCSLVAVGGGFLRIGDFVHISTNCLLSAGEGIVLEDFCGLAPGVRIFTRSDDYSGRFLTNPTVPERYTSITRGPVVLGRHVIIGAGSVIMPATVIGEGTAVGAQSLVTKSLPEWGIYFGCPARRLKARSRDLLALEQQLLQECRSSAPDLGQPRTAQ